MTPAIGLVPEAVLKLKQAHARVQVSITVDTSKAPDPAAARGSA